MTLVNKMNDETNYNETAQQQAEIIQPAVQEKNVRHTTFILIGAIVVFFAVIWFFHKKATPAQTGAAVNEQSLQIETAIAQLTGLKTENITQLDELVKRFYDFSNFEQVGTQQLKADPFSAYWGGSEGVNSAKKDAVANSDSQIEEMQVLSIMQSKYGNCSMIDDKLLYKGDKINGFEVVEIGNDFVKLSKENKNITLYLQIQ